MSLRKSRTGKKTKVIERERHQVFPEPKKERPRAMSRVKLAVRKLKAELKLDELLDKKEKRKRRRKAEKLGKPYVPEPPEKRLSASAVKPTRKQWRKKR